MKAAFNSPFDEQLAFFRQKLNLPTARWDEILGAAHDRAFVVAGAAQSDLLADLNRAVDKSLAQGTGLAEFERDFKLIVHNNGWSGWTGEGTAGGEAWRSKVIYQTNMMSSYAAGRYQQLTDPEFVKLAPFWRYVHDDSVGHPRPDHKAWGDAGLTLRYDDPFWESHFPPNGFGCMCRVTPVQDPAADAATEAPEGWDTREADGTLPGVDKGFDYQPGASVADELRKIIADKVKVLPETLGKALAEAAKKILEAPEALVFVESKTAKAAADWAVNNNLADYADYSGVKPEVANAWNKGLFDHLQEFPELRGDMKFVGTCQAQFARWREIEIQQYIARLQAANLRLPHGFDFRPHAEEQVKAKKVGNQYAHFWSQPDVQGIAVNKKFGADPVNFEKSVEKCAVSGHFPYSNTTIKSVADHEMGHALDNHLSLRVDVDVLHAYNEATVKGMKGEVSGYAAKNIQEFIAECWAESLNNPTPRAFAQKIADIVRARYAAKYQSP